MRSVRSLRSAYGWALAVCLLVAVSVSLGAVPSAPTNLAAQVVGNTVNLTWTASVAGPVLAYKLEAGSAPGLTNVATVILGNSPSFSAAAVPAGTYFVRVRAIGADGESLPSNEVTVVVGTNPGCAAPPNAPINLVGNVSGSVVTLTWAPGGGCPASNYVVQAGSAPGLSNIAVVNNGLPLALTASGPAGTYYVRVIAQNAFGASGASNEVVLQISGGGGTPSPLCNVLTATLSSAPFGDPDKAVATARVSAPSASQVFLNFTSYRRVGASWVEYDWWRQVHVFNTISVSAIIDKPALQAWRLDFRCDGILRAQLEGSR